MKTKSSSDKHKPQPGYAFRAVRRHPKEPETVVIGQDDIEKLSWVGYAVIDGTRCLAWRNAKENKYYFQVALGS